MSEIVNDAVEQYLHGLLPERDPIVTEMEELAEREKIPIVGPLVGRILWQLVRVSGAKRILELGSAIGYSTIWLARGAGEDGRVIFTDWTQQNADRALEYFYKAMVDGQIDIRVGDALKILDDLDGAFDFIFNDVDKHFYPEVFRKAIPRLRPGGMLVTDNVLWSGRVTEPDGDEDTEAIKEYNRLCHQTPGLVTTIIPVRDGVAVTVKNGVR